LGNFKLAKGGENRSLYYFVVGIKQKTKFSAGGIDLRKGGELTPSARKRSEEQRRRLPILLGDVAVQHGKAGETVFSF